MNNRVQFVVALGALGLACSGVDADSGQDGPSANGATPASSASGPAGSGDSPGASMRETVVDVGEHERVLIAEVKLSETHSIRFAEFPKYGISEVTELLDADLDDVGSSLSGAAASAKNGSGASGSSEPIDELYMRAVQAAGQQADSAVLERLTSLRNRVDSESAHATTLSEGVDRAASVAAQQAAVGEPGSAAAKAANAGENVSQTSQPLCTEKKYDWAGDDRWFRQSYCDYRYQYCDSLDAQHSPKARGKYATANFFNQSFCSAASAQMRWRFAHQCIILLGCDYVTYNFAAEKVANRKISIKNYSGSKDADGKYPEWKPTITSAQGNFTGLGFFAFTN